MPQPTWTYTDKPLPTPPGPKKAPIWATFVAGRAPEFKIHTTLGHCKNAISNSHHGIVYRWMPPFGLGTGGDPEWTPVLICNSDDWVPHRFPGDLHPNTELLCEFYESKKGLTEPVLATRIQEEPLPRCRTDQRAT